jgi:hypothetical protein
LEGKHEPEELDCAQNVSRGQDLGFVQPPEDSEIDERVAEDSDGKREVRE